MRYAISRYWHQPQISVAITDAEIGLSMDLQDYLKALSAEIGSPAMLMTQAGLLKKMQDASVVVQFKTQEATRQVM
jgi:hypothetical protein